MRSRKSAPWKKLLRWKKSRRVAGSYGTVALGTAAGCVAAVTILVAARQPQPASPQSPNSRTARAQLHQDPSDPLARRTWGQFESSNASQTTDDATAPVAITGCLVRDADTFRLEKTTGAEVPTSRSWKVAFLKKRPVSIEVVDATHRLELSRQVGQRVNVVGVLQDRELMARSLQRVAGLCGS